MPPSGPGYQLTFGSAGVEAPSVHDLAGLLVGPGHLVRSERGTRVSVVVREQWRIEALVAAYRERELDASLEEVDATEGVAGGTSVRTSFTDALDPLADAFSRGALRLPPRGLVLGGGAMRLWCIAAGEGVRIDDGYDGNAGPVAYRLGLSPDPAGWPVTGAALSTAGLPATLIGPRADGPAYRLAGVRRLRRLAELVGPPPEGATSWPR